MPENTFKAKCCVCSSNLEHKKKFAINIGETALKTIIIVIGIYVFSTGSPQLRTLLFSPHGITIEALAGLILILATSFFRFKIRMFWLCPQCKTKFEKA